MFCLFILLCAAKCLSEETKLLDPINRDPNESLFEVTGYPMTGDIPMLNRKIFRGTRVNIREHPYVVSIRRNGGHYLTGTLITRNLVLTVAHPIVNVPIQELRVVVGESYSDRGTSLLTVIVILIHQDFDPFTLFADLAMVRIYEDIVFRLRLQFCHVLHVLSSAVFYIYTSIWIGSPVKSISLVMPQLNLSGTAFVTGWGRCDFTGNELCLPRTSQYFPDEKTDPMLRSISWTIKAHNFYCEGYQRQETSIREGMLCVGGAREENSAQPCVAVPGAPLVLKAKLAGILSWGFGCGYLHDLPLIYTSTQHYTSWIAQNILIFRRLSKEDFFPLFQATKSYLILEWLSKTRVVTPVPHDHTDVYKELKLVKLDQELVKLHGTPYDIRDYIFEAELHEKKLSLYEATRKELMENKTKAEVIKNATKLLLAHYKPRPFLDNKSLSDLSVTSDDSVSDDSDDD